MKKSLLLSLSLLVSLAVFSGCDRQDTPNEPKVPFEEGQLYAVAYLGYQEPENLDYYVEQYLEDDRLPTHYLSAGDYYLVIPRHSGMELSLYRSELDGPEPTLLYHDPDCQPFLLQCNASDIFADAAIRLTYQGETVEFSPFISLKDGSVDIGEHGLDLTHNTNA